MDEIQRFQQEVRDNVASLRSDTDLQAASRVWMREADRHRYDYNFSWMGRPIIQMPQDVFAMQEIIWQVKPDLIIETGIAHGGSLIFYASMLELIGGDGYVLGIDVDIRSHNRTEIENHPMFKRIRMIQGSSIDPATVAEVAEHREGKQRVIVALDSNHAHDHVLTELNHYSPMVTKGSYLIVFDTIIQDTPAEQLNPDRPWDVGSNPKTAVWEFLKSNDRFEIDHDLEAKLLLTVCPDGYLRCTKD